MTQQSILIIDDSSVIRGSLKKFFGDEFNPLVASGGLEGIKLAKQHHPDVIILDIEMPEAFHQLR